MGEKIDFMGDLKERAIKIINNANWLHVNCKEDIEVGKKYKVTVTIEPVEKTK